MSKKFMIDTNIKNEIKDYIKYDNYIKEYELKISKIKKIRKKKKDFITEFLKNHNSNSKSIKAGNSILKLKETNTKSSLTQKFLKESITNYFKTYYKNLNDHKCIEISENILDFINNSRKTNKKILLKRIIT